MIDFHSHILPKMDDGSGSVEESVALLRETLAQGVERIFLTPHFYPKREDPEEFLHRRAHAAEKLFSCGDDVLKRIQVYLGAEVAFFYGMSRYEELNKLSLGRSQYILIEMPFDRWTQEEVRELIDVKEVAGLIPIVAHIERYLPFGNKKYIDYLVLNGILIQSNAEFFISKRTRHKALRMIKKGRIHFLGSDCHNLSARPQNYGEAVKIIGSDLLRKVEEKEKEIITYMKRPQ